MPGAVEKCKKCQNEMRWGYSQLAIDFAAGKRGADEKEIIDDFFEMNKAILRTRPQKCTKCGQPGSEFETVHRYP